MSLGNDAESRQAAVQRLEQEAARELGMQPGGNRTLRKLAAAVRRRLPRSSSSRQALRRASKQLQPPPFARIMQRRKANEFRLPNLDAIEAAQLPAREVPGEAQSIAKVKSSLPAFYHQQIGGKTQAELLEMRDWSRAQVPAGFTVAQWRTKIREELQQWAKNATKPEQLRGERPIAPTTPNVPPASPSLSSPMSPADRAKAIVDDVTTPSDTGKPTPEESKIDYDSLPQSDRHLLTKRSIDVVADKKAFARFQAIHLRHEHPDTGKPINFESERTQFIEEQTKHDAKAVQMSGDKESVDVSEPEPSRASTSIDTAQLGLDAIGFAGDAVIPGLGVAADGLNAIVSASRMFTDPSRRREHATNAVISGVSMIPFGGDLAKLLKADGAGKTLRRASKFANEKVAMPRGNSLPNLASQKPLPWNTNSINDFIDAAKEGKPVHLQNGKPSLDELLSQGASPEDATRTFLEMHGGFDQASGKIDVQRAAKAMDAMQKQASSRSEPIASGPVNIAGGEAGGNVPPIPPTRPPGSGSSPEDPSRDPRDIEREIDGQKELRNINEDFREKLTDSVLALGGFGAALVAGWKGMEKVIAINRGYVDANRYLADVDGGVAASYARHELEETKRNIRKARELREAIERSTEADSSYSSVRDRFATPIQSIGMDAASTTTQSLSNLTAANDNLNNFSLKLQIAAAVIGKLSDGVNATTGKIKDVSEYFSVTGIHNKLAAYMRSQEDGSAGSSLN